MSNHADAAPRSQDPKPWAIIMPPSFFDYDLTDREFKVFAVLDMIARMDTYCFPSQETIGKIAKKTSRAIRDILPELERKGFIRLSRITGPKARHVGVILLCRVNPDTPAANTPEAIEEAEAALRSRLRRTKSTETRRFDPSEGKDAAENRRKSSAYLSPQNQRVLSVRDSDECVHPPEIEQAAPAATVPVVSDLIGLGDDCHENACREMLRVGRRLPTVAKREAAEAVDLFAALSLVVAHDDPESIGNHRDFGWALRKGTLRPVTLEVVVDLLNAKLARYELHAPAAWYTRRVREQMMVKAEDAYRRPVCLAS